MSRPTAETHRGGDGVGRGGGTGWRRSGLLAIALLVVAAPAAAGKKRAPVYPVTEMMRVDRGLQILVAQPEVTVRAYKVGRDQRRLELPTAAIARWIRKTEIDALRRNGLAASDEELPTSALGSLLRASETLSRGRALSEPGAEALHQACQGREETAILVQHLRIRTAPDSTYDPFSGQSTLDMSNTNLRGTLFDCRDHERLWVGELYIRMLPRVGDLDFATAVAAIFANLDGEEKEDWDE